MADFVRVARFSFTHPLLTWLRALRSRSVGSHAKPAPALCSPMALLRCQKRRNLPILSSEECQNRASGWEVPAEFLPALHFLSWFTSTQCFFQSSAFQRKKKKALFISVLGGHTHAAFVCKVSKMCFIQNCPMPLTELGLRLSSVKSVHFCRV